MLVISEEEIIPSIGKDENGIDLPPYPLWVMVPSH